MKGKLIAGRDRADGISEDICFALKKPPVYSLILEPSIGINLPLINLPLSTLHFTEILVDCHF